MSATLTWASSGNGTKTGTTNAALLDDLDTLITSKSANADFSWEKAGKSNAATPRYLLLRRKDGSAGRLAIVIWDSAPAAVNTGILDITPSVNTAHMIWFPSGTGTTLSNLTAASGTVCGTDTGVIKATIFGGTVSAMYAANIVPFYFDTYEALAFAFADPASGTNVYMGASGAILVDGADVAYDGSLGFGASMSAFGGNASGVLAWTTTFVNAGSTGSVIRTNYGSANRNYFRGLTPSGVWAGQAVSSTDILTDTSLNKAWFVPVQLLGTVKGEGFVLKLRQIAYGPGSVGALTVYNTTGPVVAARQISNTTAGAVAAPWLTNFKV